MNTEGANYVPPGRPPKPTALKELAGNPGKRPLNQREPKPTVKAPSCPSYVQGEGRKEWRRVARLLVQLRVLTEADRSALAMYCMAYSRWVEAEAKIREEGMIVVSSNGYVRQNPYVLIAGEAMRQMRGLLSDFGMTPSSRAKVQVAEEREPGLDELLEGDE